MNRPARFTVADLRRALRAAEQAGPDYAVEVAPDGTIRIVRTPGTKTSRWTSVEPEQDIVL